MRVRAIVVMIAVIAVASACTSTSVPVQTKAVRNSAKVTLKQACDSSKCSGTRSGAPFTIRVPTKNDWNGTLVIWSHGYRPANPIPTNPLDPSAGMTQVDRSAELAPSKQVADKLIDSGYALVGSAFATNGWDVQDGVRANEDLYSYFSRTFGKPNRVYIWGASLGGLITQTLAEKHPEWVSGVAPMCGVLGGTNLNLDLALDVAYAVKTLIYPQLQLTGFSSADEANAQWEAASQAVAAAAKRADATAISDLFAIAAIADAPTRTQDYDGSTVTSQVKALVESIINALGYGSWGRYDIEKRVGGNPSQNTGVDYGARIGTTYQALIGNQIGRIKAALANGTRVSADAQARSKADQLGNPTGAIQRPTITMHTEYDPLVIVQNENVFAQRAAAKIESGGLVQLYTGPPDKFDSPAPYGAGHCNFTSTEFLGTVDLLDKWVRLGVYAGPRGVWDALNFTVDNTATGKNTPAKIAAGTATTGYDQNYAPSAWPAKPGGS